MVTVASTAQEMRRRPGWLGDIAGALNAPPDDGASAAFNLASALIIYLAALPFAGPLIPMAWFGVVLLIIGGARAWPKAKPGAEASGLADSTFGALLSAAYSAAALYFVAMFNGAAQTFGVTLFGVTMFQALARDFAQTRRLMANLLAPILAMVLAQGYAAYLLIAGGSPWKIITLAASPLIVFRTFRAVQRHLRRLVLAERASRQELETREARYRLIAEGSADVIVQCDLEGRVQYISPAARKFGWDPDAVTGVSAFDALHPDEVDRSRQFLADLGSLRASAESLKTWRARTADGRAIIFEMSYSPVKDKAGDVVGIVAILRDVTERMALEAKLAESEQKLRGLFQLAPIGIALTDMDGRFLEFNESFRQISGYEEDELKALDYWALTPETYAEQEQDQLELLSKTGRYGPYEKEYRRKDGELIPLRLNGMVIEDASGARHIWSIVEDVTEQRMSEAILVDARNAAEEAARAKSEFLANMSHEIRTPLTAVVGFAGLLRTMPDLPSEAGRFVDRISTSADALLGVVNDVLDFSKLEANQVELDPRPFHAAALVEDAVDLIRGQAVEKGLDVRVELQTIQSLWLHADNGKLRQVLLNLLSNALKFTDAGAITVSAGYSDDGRLKVTVEDTGIGVPPDRAERLFQRFSQVDASNTRQYGGTGLGLAISKAITEVMGGAIGATSTPGAGSTFWFEVPAPRTQEVLLNAPAPDAGDLTTERLRLLIVDDVPINRELVAMILHPFDVEVTEAAGGAEAVRICLEAEFDVILMDLQMPGMDGLTATRAIRSGVGRNAATPILALSANVLPAQVEACLMAGMNGHVAKPIDPRELLTKINQSIAIEEAA